MHMIVEITFLNTVYSRHSIYLAFSKGIFTGINLYAKGQNRVAPVKFRSN